MRLEGWFGALFRTLIVGDHPGTFVILMQCYWKLAHGQIHGRTRSCIPKKVSGLSAQALACHYAREFLLVTAISAGSVAAGFSVA